MVDEAYTIAVSDDGTINEIVALLQLLGLTGEQAAERVAGGFVNMSASQDVAAASAKAFGAAAQAGFGATDQLGTALDRLTTSEQKAATTSDALVRLTQLLTTAQNEGVAAAAAQADAMTRTAASAGEVTAAVTAQGEAVEGLSRLQQNLAARAQELDSAFLLQIASSNTYTTSLSAQQAAVQRTSTTYTDAIAELNAFERATVAANISVQGLYGTYSAGDTLFGAQAAEAAAAARELSALGLAADGAAGSFAALDKAAIASAGTASAEASSFSAAAEAATARLQANTALAASDTELASAEERAAVAIQEFIALQRECNTTTITGRDAIASASAAYGVAVDAIGAYKVELEILSSDQGKLADSALKMADGLRAAAAAAVALEAAELEAVSSTTVLEGAIARIGVVGKELGQTFGGLNAIFAGAFAVKEIVSADDAFVKLNASLATVTKGAADLNNTYNQLHTISNQTQTDISSNTKLYVQLADATKGAKIASGDLIQAVGGIDTALKLGNVTGQDAYRVMRSLSEVFSTTSGSSERFIQNLQRESPAVFALVAQSAKQLGINMNEFGTATDSAGTKVDKLETKLKTQEDAQNSTLKSADSYASTMRTASTAVSTATAALDKLSSSQNSSGIVSADVAAKEAALTSTISKQNTIYGQAAQGYTAATAAAHAKSDAAIALTKSELSAAEATVTVTQKQKDLIAIFENIYKTSGDAATQFSTVSGTLTVLKNNLIDFAGHADSAALSIGLLKDVILIAANNLDIIIPLVLAFAAGVAVVKIANLVQDLASLAKNLVVAAGAFAATNIEVIAIAAGIVLLSIGLEKLYNAFAPANKQIDIFGAIVSGAGQVASLFGTVMQGLTQKITDAAIHTQATSDATKLMSAAHTGAKAPADALTSSLTAQSAEADKLKFATTGVGDAYVRVSASGSEAQRAYDAVQASIRNQTMATVASTQAIDTQTTAVGNSNTQLATAVTDTNKVKDAQLSLNDAVKAAPTLWDTLTASISNAVKALASYVSTALQAAASAAKSLVSGSSSAPTVGSAAGHARDGGVFHVAGGSGVDSKMIAVSLGEVVTVQTPAQYHAGVRPAADPAQTHFAVGGVTAGAGVDLGTGVSLTTGAAPAAASSVTGFSDGRSSDVGQLTVATNANVSSTNDNTTATDASTTATDTSSSVTAANTNAVTANSSALVSSASAVASAAAAGTTAAQSVVSANGANTTALQAGTEATEAQSTALQTAASAANDNTRALNSNTSALTTLGTTIVSSANAVITSENNLQTTLASAANAIASAAKSSSTATTATTATTPTTTTSTSSTNTTSSKSTASDRIAAATSDISSGKANADGTVTGASGKIYQPVYTNQYASGLFGGKKLSGYSDGYGDTVTLTGGGSTVTNTYSDVAKAYNTAEVANTKIAAARDGADFYVPGGSGVDSKVMQVAVSPGESVHVRTPAQQNSGSAGVGVTGGNVTFNITTPDANSFGAAQDQIASKLVRGMRRAGRK